MRLIYFGFMFFLVVIMGLLWKAGLLYSQVAPEQDQPPVAENPYCAQVPSLCFGLPETHPCSQICDPAVSFCCEHAEASWTPTDIVNCNDAILQLEFSQCM